jgi:hypothetical protein
MDQNIYVPYPSGPKYLYITELIVISFEAYYHHNRWTYGNKGVLFVHNFWLPATFISEKFWLDPLLGRQKMLEKLTSLY